MSKEVTKTETNLPATPTGAWGTENLKTENVLIPQVYLMQGQSKAVHDAKAKVGDIIESVNHKVLGTMTEPFEFIPLSTFDTFMVQVKEGNDWKYLRTEAVTPKNAHHKTEWESIDPETKKELKWMYELKFFVLPAKDYKTALPHVLGFRSTSLKAGKALTNHFMNCKSDNIPPASYVMKVGSTKVTKNNKTFSVYEIAKGTKTSEDQLATAYKWYKTLLSGQAKVHEPTDVETAETEVDDSLDV